MKNFRVKKFLTALLIVVASVSLIAGCGDSKKEIVPLKTTTLQLDKTSLEVGAPFELSDMTVDDLEGGEAYVKKVIIKTNDQYDVIVMAWGYVFDKEKIESQTGKPFTPSVDGALLGAVGNMKNIQSTDPVKDVVINGMNGKEINGKIKIAFKGDKELSTAELRMVAFGRGDELWMVGVIRKPNDKTKTISDAVFNSLKIL